MAIPRVELNLTGVRWLLRHRIPVHLRFLHKNFYYDKFKKRFDQEVILRNLSVRTRKSYWWHINDFQQFLSQNNGHSQKDPEEASIEELRSYFQSMLTDGGHKAGSVKMGYYALKFLFTQIYHKEWAAEYLPKPKTAKTLPLVLSRDEVQDVLSVIPNFKHRMVIMFIYATGARVSECVNIKLTDIDSKRMQVNIQEGKGLKQRKVPLSPVLLPALRRYYKQYRPQHYLFEGATGKGTHLGLLPCVRSAKKQDSAHRISKKTSLRIPSDIVLQLIIWNKALIFWSSNG